MKRWYLLAAAAALVGCRDASVSGQSQPAPPAQVRNGALKESDLAQVVLSPEAERRLGIELAEVSHGRAPANRVYAGEVMLPPDATVTVAAPAAGTLAAAGETTAAAGRWVSRGEAVFSLKPLAPLQRDLKVNVAAELAAAQARVDAARARAARAERLLRDQVGSQRALETAREELQVTETALAAARGKLEQVERAPMEADVAMRIMAPQAGLIRRGYAVAGQAVAAGEPLFEVARLDTVWVRVPVYSGEARQVRAGAAAEVRSLAGDVLSRAARPVAAPPSADALASTSDFYFELPNAQGRLRPGERVSVVLPGQGETTGLQVPWAAVVHDAQGGAWVYQSLGGGGYRRRRGDVRAVKGGVALLARGPEAGAKVVTAGAAELARWWGS